MTSDKLRLDYNLNRVILDHVVDTIRLCDGNLTQSAILLGISYRTMTAMMKRWNVRERFGLPPARRGTPKHAALPSAKFARIIENQARCILELDKKLKDMVKQQS